MYTLNIIQVHVVPMIKKYSLEIDILDENHKVSIYFLADIFLLCYIFAIPMDIYVNSCNM